MSSSQQSSDTQPAEKKLKIGEGLLHAFKAINKSLPNFSPRTPVAAATEATLTIPEIVAKIKEEIESDYGHWTPHSKIMAGLVKFLTVTNIAGYNLSNVQKLQMLRIVDGDMWRAHLCQTFGYEKKYGVWGELDVTTWAPLLE
jgi:hypothetical protein